MNRTSYFLMALLFSFIGCRENTNDITVIDEDFATPNIIVTATISGQVRDTEGEAIEGAVVRIGDSFRQTDAKGRYTFNGLFVNGSGTLISISKAGYYKGYDRIYPRQPGHYYSQKVLLPKIEAGRPSAEQGGSVEFGNYRLRLFAQSVEDAAGEHYGAAVKIQTNGLSPNSALLGPALPATLTGIQTDGTTVPLVTHGIVHASLSTPAGQPLSLKSSYNAELSFPLPDALAESPPQQIPLWSFDESTGLWMEEGSAVLEDDHYTASIDRFGTWAIHQPLTTPIISFSACIKHENERPAIFQPFRIYNAAGQLLAYGATDRGGKLHTRLSAEGGTVLEISPLCGATESFGLPNLMDDTDLTDCFSLVAPSPYSLSGQLVDCTGQPLSAGRLRLQLNGEEWQTTTNDEGQFSFSFFTCTGQMEGELTAYDLNRQKVSTPRPVIINGSTTTSDIEVCSAPESYLKLNTPIIENGTYTFVWASLSTTDETVFIQCAGRDSIGNRHLFELEFPSLNLGLYDDAGINYVYALANNTGNLKMECPEPCDGLSLEIMEDEGPGGFVEGQFGGTVDTYDVFGQLVEADTDINGTFRLKR